MSQLESAPDADDREKPRPPAKRYRLRHLGKAETVVLRDSDTMRLGLHVRLETIRATSMAVATNATFRVGEQLKIRLRNDVQRITADLRGAVRWIEPLENGEQLVEIELFTRLMPLDVMSLRRAGVTDVILPDKIWV
ncbi:MAG: hypothetical protein ACT4QC_16550 [Planctomycetaceae bacterium]